MSLFVFSEAFCCLEHECDLESDELVVFFVLVVLGVECLCLSTVKNVKWAHGQQRTSADAHRKQSGCHRSWSVCCGRSRVCIGKHQREREKEKEREKKETIIQLILFEGAWSKSSWSEFSAGHCGVWPCLRHHCCRGWVLSPNSSSVVAHLFCFREPSRILPTKI